jgi:hypothetical protein
MLVGRTAGMKWVYFFLENRFDKAGGKRLGCFREQRRSR